MSSSDWRHLSCSENTLLQQLLAHDFHGKDALLHQCANPVAVTIDDNGSLKFKVDRTSPVSEVKSRVPVEGEFQDGDGVAVHVLLHVIDGYIDELELYKDDGSRIRDWSNASMMTVCPGPVSPSSDP